MSANSDKPHLWKADTLESIDFFNDWFLRFAPLTYRRQREIRTGEVANALEITENLRSLTIALLKANPGILPMLRMTAAPPLARDRLVGLAYTSKNLISSMEGSEDKPSRIPPRMPEAELDAHLTRIVDVLSELADRDLFPWLEYPSLEPTAKEDIASYSIDFLAIETERLRRQRAVDSSRTALQRNQLGQFSTPFSLANQISSYTISLCRDSPKLFLCEPACGSGVFISASIGQGRKDFSFRGIEIDSSYANICRELFADYDVEIINEDFFKFIDSETAQQQCDLVITNPPYIRHHHIEFTEKRRLQDLARSRLDIEVSGLSGLYIYYILLSHWLLKNEGIASWLIPSEFLYTNYGKALREYLAEKVTLLRIHRFDADDVQFEDALVSSCVVTYQKSLKPKGHTFDLTKGTYHSPKSTEKISSDNLSPLEKWSFFESAVPEPGNGITLEDLFHVTRGLATGNNDFFILDAKEAMEKGVESVFLVPLLPGPRELKSSVIEADAEGLPVIPNKRFLLSVTKLPEELKTKFPGVVKYLEEGIQKGVPDWYLCRSRKMWYFQEKRDPPLYLATYMGRNGSANKPPIRFFLNRSKGLVTNVFICLYPRPNLKRLLRADPSREVELLYALNAISPANIEKAGRSYGGGLQKVEPKELRSVRLESIPSWLTINKLEQAELFHARHVTSADSQGKSIVL